MLRRHDSNIRSDGGFSTASSSVEESTKQEITGTRKGRSVFGALKIPTLGRSSEHGDRTSGQPELTRRSSALGSAALGAASGVHRLSTMLKGSTGLISGTNMNNDGDTDTATFGIPQDSSQTYKNENGRQESEGHKRNNDEKSVPEFGDEFELNDNGPDGVPLAMASQMHAYRGGIFLDTSLDQLRAKFLEEVFLEYSMNNQSGINKKAVGESSTSNRAVRDHGLDSSETSIGKQFFNDFVQSSGFKCSNTRQICRLVHLMQRNKHSEDEVVDETKDIDDDKGIF